MIIALERCACVLFPLRISTLMRTKTMGAVIALSFLCLQGCYLAHPFSFRPAHVTTAAGVMWYVTSTDFYNINKVAIDTFGNIILGFSVPVIIFITVSASTTVTVVRLRTAMAWRQRSSSTTSDSLKQQVALTKMLVLVSVVYIVTMTPYVAWEVSIRVFTYYLPALHYYEVFLTISAFVHSVSQVDSAIHFFVYFSRSSRFRHMFCDMFRRQTAAKKETKNQYSTKNLQFNAQHA